MQSRICIKRLIGDIKLLSKDPHEHIEAYPDEKNMLLWYFLIRGPKFSDYAGGYYLGQIIHNPEYPAKPPDFKMLTPSGRFLINQKICLSNSSYHANEWSPMWNVKAILTGFLSIMLDDNEHGISHITRGYAEKRMLAETSIEYNKKHHAHIIKKFKRFLDAEGNPVPKDQIDIGSKNIDKTKTEPEKESESEKKPEPEKESESEKKLEPEKESESEKKPEPEKEPKKELEPEPEKNLKKN